uniref:Uncharacterized protein n=1 Tax=Panagrolaimus sp. ES5 TaxID=591445 RepID=A0AC34GL80_9BILA
VIGVPLVVGAGVTVDVGNETVDVAFVVAVGGGNVELLGNDGIVGMVIGGDSVEVLVAGGGIVAGVSVELLFDEGIVGMVTGGVIVEGIDGNVINVLGEDWVEEDVGAAVEVEGIALFK